MSKFVGCSLNTSEMEIYSYIPLSGIFKNKYLKMKKLNV